jgi:AcrR family transcriptional regulator
MWRGSSAPVHFIGFEHGVRTLHRDGVTAPSALSSNGPQGVACGDQEIVLAGSSASRITWGPAALGMGSERDVIAAALLSVAAAEGFSAVTLRKVSSAAGLPAARLRRHIGGLADGYLDALRRTFRALFIELTALEEPSLDGAVSVPEALHQALCRAATDPVATKLILSRSVESGVAGLTCREELISELATACRAATKPGRRPSRVRSEADAAALWARLAAT